MTTKSRKRNLTLFNTLLSTLNEKPKDFADAHELLNAAVLGIGYGLGLKRCTVALVNTKITRLKAYYSAGTMQHRELAGFQINLTESSLFRGLLDAPASVWLKPTTKQQIWAMIPDEFKRISGVKEFFLMSVFVAKKPVAVVYCDPGLDSISPLTDWEYNQFKAMCIAVSRGLLFHSSQ